MERLADKLFLAPFKQQLKGYLKQDSNLHDPSFLEGELPLHGTQSLSLSLLLNGHLELSC